MSLRAAACCAAVVATIACAPRTAAPPPDPRVVDFVPRPDTEVLAVENPHDHEGRPLCQRCHVRGARGVAGDPVALCAQCHDPALMKHPFDRVQPVPPPDLPLGEAGRIVCHTCHDPHSVKARRAGLRLAYGDLCKRCHTRHRPSTRVH